MHCSDLVVPGGLVLGLGFGGAPCGIRGRMCIGLRGCHRE